MSVVGKKVVSLNEVYHCWVDGLPSLHSTLRHGGKARVRRASGNACLCSCAILNIANLAL